MQAQAWFPLDVGNKYQFIKKSFLADDSLNVHWEYELYNIDVNADTTIGNYQYYKTTLFPDTWIRHDCRDSKTYVYWNLKDHLLMDYTLKADSLFEHFNPISKNVEQVRVIIDTVYFAGDERIIKGYRAFEVSSDGYTDLYLSPDIGFFNIYHQHINTGLDTTKVFYELVNADLLHNYFTNGYLPQFVFQPLTVTLDLTIFFTITVDHFYNKIFPAGSSDTGINFINSVNILNRYRKNDTIIENLTVHCVNLPSTADWSAEISPDLFLLQNGYTFEYAFETIDKSLIPVHAFSPDSGYYEFNYTPTDVTNHNDGINQFKLYQNYPNPFNPSTEINYHVQSEGIVTLKIFDILGKEVTTLVNEYKSPGNYKIDFDGHNLASGVYICQLRSGELINRIKMMLAK